MANEKIDTTQNIITPPEGDREKEKRLLEALKAIPDEEIIRLWDEFDEEERRREEEERKKKEREEIERKEIIIKIKWNTAAILNDLKENYVITEENAEMMWYWWKKVHINLPAVWNFEWFKFDYFVSYNPVLRDTFESDSELEKKSYSMNEISKLLQAMNKYMIELLGANDGDMDYEDELKYWETDNYRCKAWNCLKAITWLNKLYWLKDKRVDWRENPRAIWACIYDNCFFARGSNDDSHANLFLRLPD